MKKEYQDENELRQFLKQEKAPQLFLDIETLRYNTSAKKPSDFKNKTYSVAVSWWNESKDPDTVYIYKSHSFDELFYIFNTLTRQTNITIYIHNGNKYDNHFLLFEFKRNFEIEKHGNLYNRNAVNLQNPVRKKDLKPYSVAVAESRVKSKNNLELVFKLNKSIVTIVDTYPKTAESLREVGKKLLQAGVITEEYTKTDFDYVSFDLEADKRPQEIERYAKRIFQNLDADQHIYIDNDVILLACLKKYFSVIYYGFDFNKRTQTGNTLEHYTINDMSEFQLTGKIYDKHIKMTEYNFAGVNLFDYVKRFYRGGLNFYNSDYLAKTIVGRFFSIDINSSYPASMYFGQIPTFLHTYGSFEKPTFHRLDKSRYELFSVTIEFFNTMLSHIKSRIIKEMLTKMFPVIDGFVRLNTNTIHTIEMFSDGITYAQIIVKDFLSYDTEPFGAKEILAQLYADKTNGKSEFLIKFDEYMKGTMTEELNKVHFTAEQYASFKVLLNGIYGAPALRAFYNRFEYDEESDSYSNVVNGQRNTERNVLFSTFVTSFSLLNLLSPLACLTAKEIDKYFIYADTDSLYLNYKIFHKINPAILNPIDLGKWDIEHDNITKMHVLNHKKYAYETFEFDKKAGEKVHKNQVRSGGINKTAFDLAMPFDDFVATQFHDGKEIKATRSILTKEQQIAIYDGIVKMEKGSKYKIGHSKESEFKYEMLKAKIRDSILNDDNFEESELLYFETPYGTLSVSEVFAEPQPVEGTQPIEAFLGVHNTINILYKLKKSKA